MWFTCVTVHLVPHPFLSGVTRIAWPLTGGAIFSLRYYYQGKYQWTEQQDKALGGLCATVGGAMLERALCQ